MPAHITHILLAKDIYKTGNFSNINYDYFLTFSLGADLSKYSKVRKLSHKVKQKELILNMITYLNNNSLINDEYLLAVIYGHICHMIADKTIHPLIYEETRLCKNKKLKNHTLLEAHYDNYLLQEKLGIEVQNFNLRKHLQGNINKVYKMLDYAYYETYGYKHISRYYRLMLFLYRKYDLIYKTFSIKLLMKISKYHLFKRDNYLSVNDELFMELYQKTVNDSITELKKLDKRKKC